MSGLSKYGWIDFEYQFGADNNSLSDTFYIADDAQLEDALGLLLGIPSSGSDSDIQPMAHPRFPSFFCTGVNVLPIHQKAVQANDDGLGDWKDSIKQSCEIQGGVKLLCTFRPMDWNGASGDKSASPNNMVEETWDYSAQVMQIIANKEAQMNRVGLYWLSNGQQCANLRGAVKIVPKVDFYQKRIMKSQIPSPNYSNASLSQALACIGTVNKTAFSMGVCDQSLTPVSWPPETVLCNAIPISRKWRFDGKPMWEVGIKLAIITLKDSCLDLHGKTDYVTWNRLYHADAADSSNNPTPGWDAVGFGPLPTLTPLYEKNENFNYLTTL